MRAAGDVRAQRQPGSFWLLRPSMGVPIARPGSSLAARRGGCGHTSPLAVRAPTMRRVLLAALATALLASVVAAPDGGGAARALLQSTVVVVNDNNGGAIPVAVPVPIKCTLWWGCLYPSPYPRVRRRRSRRCRPHRAPHAHVHARAAAYARESRALAPVHASPCVSRLLPRVRRRRTRTSTATRSTGSRTTDRTPSAASQGSEVAVPGGGRETLRL